MPEADETLPEAECQRRMRPFQQAEARATDRDVHAGPEENAMKLESMETLMTAYHEYAEMESRCFFTGTQTVIWKGLRGIWLSLLWIMEDQLNQSDARDGLRVAVKSLTEELRKPQRDYQRIMAQMEQICEDERYARFYGDSHHSNDIILWIQQAKNWIAGDRRFPPEDVPDFLLECSGQDAGSCEWVGTVREAVLADSESGDGHICPVCSRLCRRKGSGEHARNVEKWRNERANAAGEEHGNE